MYPKHRKWRELAITENTEDRGTVSVTTSAEALGMPTALAGNQLQMPGTAWVSSNATFTMHGNTGVASVMAEDFGLTSITAVLVSGLVAIL